MPHINSNIRNANLGWIFYKKYFDSSIVAKDEKNDSNNVSRDTLANTNLTLVNNDFSKFDKGLVGPTIFQLFTTYPGLILGTGYTHTYEGIDKTDAFKLGFYFDHVSGQPCIPGHSVKGVLRSVFPNHKKEKYGTQKSSFLVKLLGGSHVCMQKLKDYLSELNIEGFNENEYSDALFSELLGEIIFEGKEPVKYKDRKFTYESFSIYKKDIFHDSFITEGGKQNKFLANDYITPHKDNPLKNPDPLQFLKVLPNVAFTFNFDLKSNLISKQDKEDLFKQILLMVGIGAKTNIGYGQFSLHPLVVKELKPNLTSESTKGAKWKNDKRNYNKPSFETKNKYERQIEINESSKNVNFSQNLLLQQIDRDFPLPTEDLLGKFINATIIEMGSGNAKVKPHYKNSDVLNIQGKILSDVGSVICIQLIEKSGKGEKLKFTKAKLK